VPRRSGRGQGISELANLAVGLAVLGKRPCKILWGDGVGCWEWARRVGAVGKALAALRTLPLG